MAGLKAERLKTRADFLRAQRGIRRGSAGLNLELCETPEAFQAAGRFRLGFTASKKVGGAVERNRAKRRLRAAAQAVLPGIAHERCDYVLIAKTATLTRPFEELLKDLAQTLAAAHVKLAQGKTIPNSGPGDGNHAEKRA
ncbi:ribonuclease P protein component [Rhizomicrobium palustre]|uniref:Ribonuclease P protein component n=1 Tax=Rhizomicrobium palustre TaxID=189966 RepID=A0A846MXI8_9PROT|nr:ribonuclease P protein component [Rhizomicrobium palustre]NIK87851.1 ribonuclease P protein component [Rhizomicrobium palustre]